MPVSVRRINRMYRLVEPDGSIAKTSRGRARDGGGHLTKRKATAQASAMNAPRNRMQR